MADQAVNQQHSVSHNHYFNIPSVLHAECLHVALREDLMQTEKWTTDQGMNLDTNKCHILSVKTNVFYNLNN